MGAGKMTLPQGFELDQQPVQASANGLPEGFEVDAESPEPSVGESAGLGFAKGASFGGLAMIPAVHLKTLLKQPLKEDVTLSTGETFAAGTVPEYEDRLRIAREQQKQAEEAHPVINTAAQIAGGIAPAVLPGGGAVTAGKGAATGIKGILSARNIVPAAAEGALSGIGYSEVIDSGDKDAIGKGVGEAVKGAALGAAGGALIPLLGKGVKALKGKAGAQILSGLTEVDEEAVKHLMNPATRAAMNTTKTLPVIGEEMVEHANAAINKIREGSTQAFKTLEQTAEKAAPKEIEDIFTSAADTLQKKNIGGTYDKAVNDIIQMADRAGASFGGQPVGLDKVKSLIWELDDRISWDGAKLTPAEKIENNAFKEIRQSLDSMIKTRSPEYAKIMKKVADDTKEMQDFRKTYHSNPEQLGRALSDYMKASRQGVQKTEKQKLIDTLAKHTDPKFIEEAKAVWARDQFTKAVGKGSTNANVGMVIGGAAIGTPLIAAGIPAPIAIAIGSAIGGVFGKIYNSYGSRMTRAMLEKYIESAEAKEMSKVPSPLKQPLKEFAKAMSVIPSSDMRRAVVNTMLQHDAMKRAYEQPMTVTPQGAQIAFSQVAR